MGTAPRCSAGQQGAACLYNRVKKSSRLSCVYSSYCSLPSRFAGASWLSSGRLHSQRRVSTETLRGRWRVRLQLQQQRAPPCSTTHTHESGLRRQRCGSASTLAHKRRLRAACLGSLASRALGCEGTAQLRAQRQTWAEQHRGSRAAVKVSQPSGDPAQHGAAERLARPSEAGASREGLRRRRTFADGPWRLQNAGSTQVRVGASDDARRAEQAEPSTLPSKQPGNSCAGGRHCAGRG